MTAKSEHAIRVVLKHEGGYTVDHAGPTKYGVSLRSLQAEGDLDFDLNLDGVLTGADIRAMRVEDAIRYYHEKWWERYGYENIESVEVATKVLDLSVVMGPSSAHKQLQRGLRACGYTHVVDDGILGPITMEATNRATPGILAASIRSEAAGWFRALVYRRMEACKQNPALPDFHRFKAGWLNRAYS